jgi:hypothetical protein
VRVAVGEAGSCQYAHALAEHADDLNGPVHSNPHAAERGG